MAHKLLLFLALGTFASNCSGLRPEPAGPDAGGPPEPADAAPPADAGTPCERACRRLEVLGCPLASPAGAPCVDICENAETSGVARFCPEEVSAIRACSELDRAFAACEHQ